MTAREVADYIRQIRDALPRRLPVYPMAYFGNAIDCNLEELKGVKDSPKCNRDTWKRENDTPSDSSHRKP